MTKMLDILEDYCLYRGHTYCRLDGSSSTMEREEMMAAFNSKVSCWKAMSVPGAEDRLC